MDVYEFSAILNLVIILSLVNSWFGDINAIPFQIRDPGSSEIAQSLWPIQIVHN